MSTSTTPASICVAGCGHWGKNLVRNFHQLGKLGGLFDANAEHLAKFGEQYPGVKQFASFADAIADPSVNAVAIATPAEMHARMAIQALDAGKDAFVEKPLALTAEDGQAMVDAARRNNRILMVGHLLIYHPAIRAIKELIDKGELGRVEYLYSNRLSMGKIRREENALWSFAPHDISILLLLTGQTPMQATAVGGTYLQPNIADVTVSNLLFESGTRAHIFVSWLHPYKEQRLVVIGSKKMVVFEDSRATDKVMIYDKEIAWRNGNFEVSQPKGAPVAFPADEPLRMECQEFIDCVETRRAPRTPGEDGVRVLQVLQASQRSLEMNGAPVQITALSRVG
ncbi:MAG: Gfo/Idh/MocA family oxidoreductase [Bryobacterales bacterium]|nr:Gfo/Idh/MocA family oxidoreductase [Bryobacterales bacterium]